MNKLNTLSITELKIRMTACIDIYERKRIEYADCYNPNFGTLSDTELAEYGKTFDNKESE